MNRLPKIGDVIYAERAGTTTHRTIAEVYVGGNRVRTVDGNRFEVAKLSYDYQQKVWLEEGNLATSFAKILRSVGLAAVALSLAFVMNAGAWDTRKNPDVAPSLGWGVHGGQLAGIASDKSAYTEFGADVRAPITNYLTLTVDYAHTTVSNAPLGVSTDSNRIGGNVRVYLRDFLGD